MMLNVRDALAAIQEVSEDIRSLSEVYDEDDETGVRLQNAAFDLEAAAKVIETHLERIRDDV